jgi:hypothetical protein
MDHTTSQQRWAKRKKARTWKAFATSKTPPHCLETRGPLSRSKYIVFTEKIPDTVKPHLKTSSCSVRCTDIKWIDLTGSCTFTRMHRRLATIYQKSVSFSLCYAVTVKMLGLKIQQILSVFSTGCCSSTDFPHLVKPWVSYQC